MYLGHTPGIDETIDLAMYLEDRGVLTGPERTRVVSVAHRGQTCANCDFAYQHVVSKRYICSQIAPYIEPAGWCRLWAQGVK